MTHCLNNGVTSVHALEDNDTWDILCDLVDHDQLPLRVFYVPYWQNRRKHGIPQAGQCKGKLLSCDRVKIFSDGALGPSTAAISVPYKGSTNNTGLLWHTQVGVLHAFTMTRDSTLVKDLKNNASIKSAVNTEASRI